jgi:hypothetical protein
VAAKQHQFIYHAQGRKAFAILPIADHEKVLKRLEDATILDERKNGPRDWISFDAFVKALKREGRISS